MFTKNAQQFKSFLEKKDIHLEFIEGNEGATLVEIREGLKSGGRLRILVIFDEDESMVSIYGGDFITGISPVKINYMYEAVNNLNIKYTYYKYVLEKDSISIQSYALFNNNFSSEVVMKMIFGMINVADSEYPSLMKIMWS